MRTKLSAAALAWTLVPAVAAASDSSLVTLSQSIQTTVFKPLIYIIIGFALLLFLWGVVKYIAHSGDQKSAEEGSKLMSYGILVLFVMTCLWGLVKLGLAFFGFSGGADASPSSSVFGISTQSYSSGQSYSTGDYDYSYTYNYLNR